MSKTGLSSHHNNNNNNKTHKNSFHRRNNSGELDISDADKYFSRAANDQNPAGSNSSGTMQNIQTRMSLDMPLIMRNTIIPPEFQHALDQNRSKSENKISKQPSSPGVRLASFLNSLFHQASLTKKKSKPGKDPEGDDEIAPGGRRKLRSRMSHFRILTGSSTSSTSTARAAAGGNSLKKSSYGNTYWAIPSPKSGGSKTGLEDDVCTEEKESDHEPRNAEARSRAVEGKKSRNLYFEFSNRKSSEERDLRKLSDADGDDDGADSDSSSDLFELPNHGLDFYSGGLPVYETTDMDRIKIVAPISGAPTVHNSNTL
ncbi:hypothetical protein OROHE_023041 [Orobanche hederae]